MISGTYTPWYVRVCVKKTESRAHRERLSRWDSRRKRDTYENAVCIVAGRVTVGNLVRSSRANDSHLKSIRILASFVQIDISFWLFNENRKSRELLIFSFVSPTSGSRHGRAGSYWNTQYAVDTVLTAATPEMKRPNGSLLDPGNSPINVMFFLSFFLFVATDSLALRTNSPWPSNLRFWMSFQLHRKSVSDNIFLTNISTSRRLTFEDWRFCRCRKKRPEISFKLKKIIKHHVISLCAIESDTKCVLYDVWAPTCTGEMENKNANSFIRDSIMWRGEFSWNVSKNEQMCNTRVYYTYRGLRFVRVIHRTMFFFS